MPDSTTPNYGWTLPTNNADDDTWGTLLNANWSALDGALYAVSNTAGAAMPKAGGSFTGSIAGTSAGFSGAVSAGGFSGPLTGNVTGNLSGNVSGATGSFSGVVSAGGFSGPLSGNVTGNVSGSSGACTGNASTASAWASSPTVTLGGDLSGSASFNASSFTLSGTVVGASTSTAGKVQLAAASDILAGTNGALAATPASLANLSLGPGGYAKLPGGLIIQWGSSTTGSTFNAGSVSFPMAFPNAVFSITATCNSTGSNGYSVSTGNPTASGFTNTGYQVATPGPVAVAFDWIAIGH